jgi:L-threonylcarbamoyladenylate synthase
MRFIEIDTKKPDMESLRAAIDLLEQDYPIVFPSDTTYGILMRFSPVNAHFLHQLRRSDTTKPFLVVVSEDFPWHELIATSAAGTEFSAFAAQYWPGPNTLLFPKAPGLAYPPAETIAIRMPAETTNRAFHTLLQLCDFPIMAPSFNLPGKPIIAQQTEAEASFPEIEYAFWDAHFEPSAPSAIWDLTNNPPSRIR